MDMRVIVNLATVRSNHRLIEEEEYYCTHNRVKKPFVVTTEHEMYPGKESLSITENDPVNTIEAALDTSDPDKQIALKNQYIEAERMIGNRRKGLLRDITHLGTTLSINQISDLTAAALTEIPFFPPLPSDFVQPDRISLITTDGGYKEYIKSKDPASGSPYSALKATEATGQKTIIWDGAHAEFLRHVDTTDYPVSADDSKNVKVADIETVLDGALGKGGLSEIHANLGGFLPNEKEWVIIDIPAQTIMKMTNTGFSVKVYNAAFSAVESSFTMEKNGDTVIDAGTGILDLNGGTVRINGIVHPV